MIPRRQFAGVPNRACADHRLKKRHFRVLIAICRAYNKDTGLAHVSQVKLGQWTGLSRQYINRTVSDIEKFGYIESVRGKSRKGRAFRCHTYRIVYEAVEPLHHSAPNAKADSHRVDIGVDAADVDTGVDTRVSTAGATQSDSLLSDQVTSEARELARRRVHKHAGTPVSTFQHGEPTAAEHGLTMIDNWEKEQRQTAYQHITDNLKGCDIWQEIMALPSAHAVLEAAVAVEIRRSGAGTKYILTAINNARAARPKPRVE